MILPAPAVYFPFLRGSYDVNPNLKRLGTDFGNGEADGHAFQIDSEYPRFVASKARSIAELRSDLDKALALIPGKHRLNLHAPCRGHGSESSS
jgi:hypothetical protein